MLNMDEGITKKLQEMIDDSGDALQAIWTNSESHVRVFMYDYYNQWELVQLYSDIIKIFPNLESNSSTKIEHTFNHDELVKEREGYYVLRKFEGQLRLLNEDKEVVAKLQSLLDNSGDSIQAIWTDSYMSFQFYTPNSRVKEETLETFSKLLEMFPELKDNPRINGGTSKNDYLMKSHDYGFYVTRTK